MNQRVWTIYKLVPRLIPVVRPCMLALRANAPPNDKTYAIRSERAQFWKRYSPNNRTIQEWHITSLTATTILPWPLRLSTRHAITRRFRPMLLTLCTCLRTSLQDWDCGRSRSIRPASAAAARKQGLAGDELHATDYLVYAYLQTGQDLDARKLVASMSTVRSDDAAYFAGLYATASTGVVPRGLSPKF